MSVPVNQRSESKLEVCVQSHDLCCYTIQITSNEKNFPIQFQHSLTDKIVDTAIEIHTLVWSANNVYVNSHEDYINRHMLQEQAAIKCNVLLSLIEIAHRVYHLSSKRVTYWMDDFLMISNDKPYLEECQDKAIKYLQGLQFEINEKKTRIYSLKDGIDFLGFEYQLTDTGKVLMFVRPKNVKRERLKLRRLAARSNKGLIPRDKVDESYAAWRNHASKGNSYKLLQRMDNYYLNLWRK